MTISIAVLGCGPAYSPKLTTFRVGSSSMAPNLWGPRYDAKCTACNSSHWIAAETFRASFVTRCPTCGGVCDIATNIIPGEIISVDSKIDSSPPRRFSRVAVSASVPAASSAPAESFLVKRVWGLPGERISIVDGEFWLGDTLFQKTIEEFEHVAIPVAKYLPHTTHTEPIPDAMFKFPQQMLPLLEATTDWTWTLSRPARVAIQDVPQEQWMEPSVLLDDDPFNQGLSRKLNSVNDWLLRISWLQPLDSPVQLFVHSGGSLVQVVVRPASKRSVTDAVGQKRNVDVPEILVVDQCSVAVCDGRLLARSAVDSWTQKVDDLKSIPSDSSEQHPTPFAIRMLGGADTVASVELYRDLYLTATPSDANAWTVPYDSVFVLGDNLPASSDSRHELGYVPMQMILGEVVE